MEVTCQNCNSKLTLPDDKVPAGKTVSFNCPSCKGKVTVTGSQGGGGKQVEEGHAQRLDATQPGAMLCHNKPDALKEILEGMGYQVHNPTSHIDANKNFQFNKYNLILITQDFEKVPHDCDSILTTLQNANMDSRRESFVIYVGSDVESFHGMQAYGLSVDAVISTDDASKGGDELVASIKNAIDDKELSYRVFFETMKELGRA